MVIPFDDALALSIPRLAAWDCGVDDEGLRTLSIFSLEGGGARQIALRDHPVGTEEAITAGIRARGLDVGRYDLQGEHVWCLQDGAIRAWDRQGLVLASEGDVLVRSAPGAARVPRDAMRTIRTYVGPRLVERGVVVELSDGGEVVLAREIATAPSMDPTYNRNDLVTDTVWAVELGKDLARWAGVPFVDRI